MVYSEKPNTEIEWVEGESNKLRIRYAAGEMQGWRLNMVSGFLRYCYQILTNQF